MQEEKTKLTEDCGIGSQTNDRKESNAPTIIAREILATIFYIGAFIFNTLCYAVSLSHLGGHYPHDEMVGTFKGIVFLCAAVLVLSLAVTLIKSRAGMAAGALLNILMLSISARGVFDTSRGVPPDLGAASVAINFCCSLAGALICVFGLVRIIKEWRARQEKAPQG